MDFTTTPLAEPAPDDATARVHRYARDLAWGAVNDYWDASHADRGFPWGESATQPIERRDQLAEWKTRVWNDQLPSLVLLEAFDYLRTANSEWKLTPKAFALLDKPLTAPSVFISYRRRASSAFGLLLVARLKAVGVQNPFIDMNIQPGDEWHAQLESIVRASRYFILLIGDGTLESDYVQQEIGWALDTPNMVIIPVLHDGLGQSALPPDLASKQAVVVERESAEYYELAVVKVLNRLGYTP
jgi:hypothetical protein